MVFNSTINVVFNCYSFIVILIWNVGSHSEHNECTDVDCSLHFLAVCLVLKGLMMDQLINPKHSVYAYNWECYGVCDSEFLLLFSWLVVYIGFGGLAVACWPLVPKFAGSNSAEAVGFLGRKNPQHAFLRRRSKTVGPMSYIYGM